MPDCSSLIVSEETGDYIIEYNSLYFEQIQRQDGVCISCINDTWCILYTNYPGSRNINIQQGYYSVPKLYGLMDTTSFDASGITATLNQPLLNVRGQGVLIGFLDTGIDYLREDFKASGGRTRIAAVWDQTIQSVNYEEDTGEAAGTEQYDREQVQGMVQYGTVYTREDINAALAAEREGQNPYDIVPSRDENGHGTFLAGVACGNKIDERNFSGVAPLADICVVKCREAKDGLKRYFRIGGDKVVYGEQDIMLGIKYLWQTAVKAEKPLIICFGIGTNIGGHERGGCLGEYLESRGNYSGVCAVAACGNEANAGHHYRSGLLRSGQDVEVELRTGSDDGFTIELWGDAPNLYAIGIISPSGEYSGKTTAKLGEQHRIRFVLEKTVVDIDYLITAYESGDECVRLRFSSVEPGLWKIRVFNDNRGDGFFDMWLPIKNFITDETYFLESDPDVTICNPANNIAILSNAYYNSYTTSAVADSSRGYTRSGYIKPDICSPGIDIFGPMASVITDRTQKGDVSLARYGYMSGSSAATAITAGAAALLMEWGIIRKNDITMDTVSVKKYLIRGTINTGVEVPNRICGYGGIDLYGVFQTMRGRI